MTTSPTSQITTNFVNRISFDNINSEDYFEYTEEAKKDQLEFNLNLLNNNEELDLNAEVTSQTSNIDEFYDAICKFNSSANYVIFLKNLNYSSYMKRKYHLVCQQTQPKVYH